MPVTVVLKRGTETRTTGLGVRISRTLAEILPGLWGLETKRASER